MQVQVQEGACQAVCDSLVDGQLGGACVQQDVRGQGGDTGQEEQEQGSSGEEGGRHGGWLGGSNVLGVWERWDMESGEEQARSAGTEQFRALCTVLCGPELQN